MHKIYKLVYSTDGYPCDILTNAIISTKLRFNWATIVCCLLNDEELFDAFRGHFQAFIYQNPKPICSNPREDSLVSRLKKDHRKDFFLSFLPINASIMERGGMAVPKAAMHSRSPRAITLLCF